jgi:hypothetical protein
MGRFRLTRRHRALLGYILGCVLVVAGAWVAQGLAAALIVAGIITAASFLLLTDVDEGGTGEPPAVAVAHQRRSFDPTL